VDALVGAPVGALVDALVGAPVGALVDALVGAPVGALVDALVGPVGALVGPVGAPAAALGRRRVRDHGRHSAQDLHRHLRRGAPVTASLRAP
jgi:hypothetical protein